MLESEGHHNQSWNKLASSLCSPYVFVCSSCTPEPPISVQVKGLWHHVKKIYKLQVVTTNDITLHLQCFMCTCSHILYQQHPCMIFITSHGLKQQRNDPSWHFASSYSMRVRDLAKNITPGNSWGQTVHVISIWLGSNLSHQVVQKAEIKLAINVAVGWWGIGSISHQRG